MTLKELEAMVSFVNAEADGDVAKAIEQVKAERDAADERLGRLQDFAEFMGLTNTGKKPGRKPKGKGKEGTPKPDETETPPANTEQVGE